jgi:hypothetical protein
MSDTPRTDDQCDLAQYDARQWYEFAGKLERELNEANADRLRMRDACEIMIIGICAAAIPHSGERATASLAVSEARKALTTPPPPVVAKADADALAEAVEIMRVGICSAAMPNATEREIASDAVKQASEVLKTYRNKYKEGKQ